MAEVIVADCNDLITMTALKLQDMKYRAKKAAVNIRNDLICEPLLTDNRVKIFKTEPFVKKSFMRMDEIPFLPTRPSMENRFVGHSWNSQNRSQYQLRILYLQSCKAQRQTTQPNRMQASHTNGENAMPCEPAIAEINNFNYH